jgi:ABC-2 type transport system ATP-binding protein
MSDVPAIQIKNLTKQYGTFTALHGVDLEVPQGSFMGLLGPNGAGKTTTINILAGLSNKTDGEVSLFGYDLIRDYRECRQRVGLVPQEFNFDQFTKVKKILMFQGGYFGLSQKERTDRAEELMDEFELSDKANSPARALSGGMKRRLLIARALMHKPKLLILDEPTAGVDVDLRKALWKFLRKHNQEGTTILLTTHYIEEAEALTNHIAIINHGKIIAEDSTRRMANRMTSESIVVTSETTVSDSVLERLQMFKPEVSTDRYEITLTFDKITTPYPTVLEHVTSSDIQLVSIRPVDNRLESVFLELTRNVQTS